MNSTSARAKNDRAASINGDVVDLDATLDQEFFDVSIRESVAEVPTDRPHYLGRESVARERGTIFRERPIDVMSHLGTLADRRLDPSTQRCLSGSHICTVSSRARDSRLP